ncbi:MAG: ABC transporter permease subunit, partial [Candidatus Freyarchaeota archaeon]
MGLKEYVLRRLVDSTATFLLIFILNFLLFYSRMPECEGLPIWTQFHRYLTFVFLNGFRTQTHPDTMKIIVSKLPITLLLLGLSTLLAIFLGITFGAIASWKRGKVDILLTICLLVPYITPSWWLALLFIALFHPWFPIHGWRTMERWISISPWSDPIGFTGDVLWNLALPASSLTLSLLGIYFLVTRNNMLNVSAEDYVTTARAKGVNTRSIIFRHILRNAILPITTVA